MNSKRLIGLAVTALIIVGVIVADKRFGWSTKISGMIS